MGPRRSGFPRFGRRLRSSISLGYPAQEFIHEALTNQRFAIDLRVTTGEHKVRSRPALAGAAQAAPSIHTCLVRDRAAVHDHTGDLIGGMLTEINITSPTGIRELKALTGVDAGDLFIEAIEREVLRRGEDQ